jgi:hypothetical protein
VNLNSGLQCPRCETSCVECRTDSAGKRRNKS